MNWMIIAVIAVAGYMIGHRAWFQHETKRKLELHQIQWDTIKRQLPSDADVDDEYIKFCDHLRCVHRNESTGACFPRK